MGNEVYNDNSIAYGGQLIIINSGSYVADDVVHTFSAKIIERPDQIGGPNGFAIVKSQPTFSATVQIATNATARPALGQTFTSTYTTTGTEVWAISNVSEAWRTTDYVKCNISALQTKATIG